MNRDYLKQIMIDQKETYLNNPMINRDYPLEDNVNYCFVGIRRTGKSYMMYQQIKHLQENGIPLKQIVYVNFEDERLLELSADDLNLILEIGLEMSGADNKPYLFLDEIQNVVGWEKFVRRIADMKYRIHITGSNSKMLSSEIASTLGGRFMRVDIYPYSFPEYLAAQGKDKNYLEVLSTKDRAEVVGMCDQYVKYGAFPELVDIRNKREYLNSIYQTIYLGDIMTRNKITNDFAVRLILKKIAESVAKPLSFNRLSNILKSAGAVLGKQTVINYVGYMMDSYLLFTLQNYAAKLVEKEHPAVNESFNPRRKGILRFLDMSLEEKEQAVKENPDYGEVICRCETVTRAEILQAVHNPLGVCTVTGIKNRTRATMGRCQGGYCETRITDLIQKEIGISEDQIRYSRKNSYMFTGKVRDEK